MLIALHLIVIILLTLATQIGGLIYIAALLIGLFVRKGFNAPRAAGIIVFLLAFVGGWFATYAFLMPKFSMQLGNTYPLPCNNTEGVASAHPIYCLTFRNYARINMFGALKGVADGIPPRDDGGAVIRTMDAGFPISSSMFPMFPHTGHREGNQVDIALWYEGGAQPSPIGYYAFSQPPEGAPPACPEEQQPGFFGTNPMPAIDARTTGAAFAAMGGLSGDNKLAMVEAAPHVYAAANVTPGEPGSIYIAANCAGGPVSDRITLTVSSR